MKRRMIFPLILGGVGAAILCALGVWQLQRLAWKSDIIAKIEQRLTADPISIPTDANEEEHEYLSVDVAGNLVGPEIHVLVSQRNTGPGYRVIQKFETLEGRAVMADLGFIKETEKTVVRQQGGAFIQGNLLWPNETDAFVAAPNFEKNIWFARENAAMADALGAEPVLVVVKTITPQRSEQALPVTAAITNDHLQYAITWFALMAVWIAMTLFLLFRISRYEAAKDRY